MPWISLIWLFGAFIWQWIAIEERSYRLAFVAFLYYVNVILCWPGLIY